MAKDLEAWGTETRDCNLWIGNESVPFAVLAANNLSGTARCTVHVS
jgi:hypothetical protein